MAFGFLNLNKPAGWTSHDCVAKVRRLVQQKRVGHAGTLDPAATGVLPIAIGRATRLLRFLPTAKTYIATIQLGRCTTTDDLEGAVVATEDASHLTAAQVTAALTAFHGEIQQLPPAYSAVQVQGKRLYELARQGAAIPVVPRTVQIDAITVQHWQSGPVAELQVKIACGAGTYIRAIARDLGQNLGVGGTLAQLVRVTSGGFDLADSITLEQLAAWSPGAPLPLVPPAIALHHLPAITLPSDTARRWSQGQHITLPPLANPPTTTQFYRVLHADDAALLGVAHPQPQADDWLLKADVVLV